VDPYAPYPLEHDGHAVQDDGALGNGDGIVDPGETVVMPETLRNNGSDTITSIAAELGVTRPDLVRITRPMATYPDMPPGGARESDVPHYRYTVSPETPCGTELRFELALSSSAGAGGTDFTLTVGCNPLECGGDPAPSAEVAGLRIERSGSSDLRLSWQALAGASGYRVWKSARPDSGTQKFVGSTTGTEIVEPNGAAGLEGWFYQVKATNSCEWEGP
jgi:hypothetical protein